MNKWYVHYTVENPKGVKQHLKAGPYSEAEVLDQRRDIATYSGVIDAYVHESDQRVKD